MDAAWNGSGQAHAQAASGLRLAARHNRGRFLVAYMNEADLVLMDAAGFHDTIDPVAGQAEDRVDPPIDQALDQDFRGRSGHSLFAYLSRFASGVSSGDVTSHRKSRVWSLPPSASASAIGVIRRDYCVGNSPRVTDTFICCCLRSTLNVTVSPGLCPLM